MEMGKTKGTARVKGLVQNRKDDTKKKPVSRIKIAASISHR